MTDYILVLLEIAIGIGIGVFIDEIRHYKRCPESGNLVMDFSNIDNDNLFQLELTEPLDQLVTREHILLNVVKKDFNYKSQE